MTATDEEEHPPTYEEAIGTSCLACVTGLTVSNGSVTQTPAAMQLYIYEKTPPPSYQSIFGEIKDVRRQSDNFAEFLVKVCILLASTIGFAIVLGFLLAIPISMIVIGAKYKDDCPREDKIPIYLIVAGSVLIVRNLSNMCSRASKRNDDDDDNETEEDEKNPVHKCCDSILDLFTFCWFITGNYWIYHIYQPSYHSYDGDEYCNKTLYLFAFWITTSTYIIAGFLCCCLCCIGICVAAVSDEE